MVHEAGELAPLTEEADATPQVFVAGPRCPFCREALLAAEPKRGCGACMAWHHDACVRENRGRCATCAADMPATPAGPAQGALERVRGRFAPPGGPARRAANPAERALGFALGAAALLLVFLVAPVLGAALLALGAVVLFMRAVDRVGRAQRVRRRQTAPGEAPAARPQVPAGLPPAKGEGAEEGDTGPRRAKEGA